MLLRIPFLVAVFLFTARAHALKADAWLRSNAERVQRDGRPRPLTPATLPSTNAERLRLGLPLKAPGRRSFPFQPQTSSTPAAMNGYITVNDLDGNFLAYFSCDMYGDCATSSTASSATLFTFTLLSDGSAFSIGFQNPSALESPYLGPSGGDPYYGPTSDDYGSLTSIAYTSPGSYPVMHKSQYSESSVYTYDSTTGLLTLTWTNPNTEIPATQALSVTRYTDFGYIFITGDPALFIAGLPSVNVQVVALHFVSGTP